METPKSAQSLCTVWRCLHSMKASLLKPRPKKIFETVWPKSGCLFSWKLSFFGFRTSRSDFHFFLAISCLHKKNISQSLLLLRKQSECLVHLFPLGFQSFGSRADYVCQSKKVLVTTVSCKSASCKYYVFLNLETLC